MPSRARRSGGGSTDDVAEDLERPAHRGQTRGGLAAAAAFWDGWRSDLDATPRVKRALAVSSGEAPG